MNQFARRVLLLGLFVAVSPPAQSQPSSIRGFTSAHAEGERQVEEKFRAVPKPENLREYMR